MVSLMTLADIERYRAGDRNPQGWPFEPLCEPKGRSTCRCCGKKVKAGEDAIVGFVKFAGTQNAWGSTRVVLHRDCEPCEGERRKTANY